MIKIIFQVYNPKTKKPPFDMIDLKTIEVEKIPKDESGLETYYFLKKISSENGFVFRFYSTKDDSKIYEVVVHNLNSPGSEYYMSDHLNNQKGE